MKNKNSKISKRTRLLGLLLVALCFLPLQNVLAVMYAPGQELNPTCGPTDPDCGVIAPAFTTDSMVNGSILYSSSSSAWSLLSAGIEGQVLKISGGVLSWGADNSGSGGLTSLNSLTSSSQTFAVGTTGTDFGITSSGSTHTFNLPTASSSNRGLLSSTDWSTFNSKQNALGFTPYDSTNPSNFISDGNTGWDNSYGFITSYTETDPTISAWAKATTKPSYTASEIGLGNVPNLSFSGSNTGDETTLSIQTKLGTASTSTAGYLTSTDWNTFNGKVSSPITVVNTSNLFSTGLSGTGSGVTTVTNSNFFGVNAGHSATSASDSNFFGSGAGRQATNAYSSNFIGNNAGLRATNANGSNFIGIGSGSDASNAPFSNFIGYGAGNYADSSANSNFLGNYAGGGASNASFSNLFGYQTGRSFTDNNIGSNNIIIGTNISLPNNTENAINLGGVIFATGTQSDVNATDPYITAVSTGNVGIGVVSPTARLQLASGTTSASTAPLKFTSGTNLTTPEAGAIEWDGINLFITQTSGPTRKTLAYTTDIPSISGYIPYTGGTSNVDFGVHNLTVDTTSLFVDATNHRVGVGTITPSQKMDVIGNINLATSGNNILLSTFKPTGGDGYNIFFGGGGQSSTSAGGGSSFQGSNNSSFGYNALNANTSGYRNTAIGYYSMSSNLDGNSNTAVGYQALKGNTSGTINTAIGMNALYATTSGTYNIGIGSDAGRFYGGSTGANTGSNNSIFIGAGTRASANSNTNEIVIGDSTTGSGSNTVTLGNDSITSTILKGKLGVGVTSPTNTLSLNNSQAQKIWIENTANTVVGRALTVAAGSTVTGGTADMAGGNLILSSGAGKGTGASSISFLTGTTLTTGSTLQTLSEKMTILGSGYVGIGVTAPLSQTHIKSSITTPYSSTGLAYSPGPFDVLSLDNADDTTGDFTSINIINRKSTGNAVSRIALVNQTGSNSSLAFLFRDSSSTTNTIERMRITSGGNVGIGTTNPGYKLDLSAITVAVSQSGGMRIGANDQYSLRNMIYTTAGGVPYAQVMGPKDVSGWLAFTTGASDTESMRITSAGNLGLGVTAPAEKLEVSGNAKIGGAAYITNNSNNILGIQTGNRNIQSGGLLLTTPYGATNGGVFLNSLYDGTDGRWEYAGGTGVMYSGAIAFDGSNGLLNIQSSSSTGSNGDALTMTSRLAITKDGYVGMGVSSPTYRLELPNTADATGQGRANAWQTYSDQSLKENVLTLSDSLDKVLQLRGVSFDWKSSGAHSSGFIAQEVEQILPELVSTGSDGIKSLDYGRFTPYLVEGLKAMDQKMTNINDLEKENSWRDSIVTWFKNTANGIGEFVAGIVRAKDKLCIGEGSEEVCITKEELLQIKNNSSINTNVSTSDNQVENNIPPPTEENVPPVETPPVENPPTLDSTTPGPDSLSTDENNQTDAPQTTEDSTTSGEL